ncbi:hypothetical protein BWD42_23955 [Sphingobacterium sp. CZ-UAM]|nr:hypothetical protein BWD42_23955 [Sphingobacterium sp. CZ-UAM]
MKQSQTNGKGQGYGHRLTGCSGCSVVGKQLWGYAALLREARPYLAGDRMILPAACRCAGLTIRWYRRKFAVFPPGGSEIIGLTE